MSNERQNDPNVLLANVAAESGILTPDRSLEALNSWQSNGGGKDFGMFLVASGHLSPDKLWELMQARDDYVRNLENGEDKTRNSSPDEPSTEAAAPMQTKPELVLSLIHI